MIKTTRKSKNEWQLFVNDRLIDSASVSSKTDITRKANYFDISVVKSNDVQIILENKLSDFPPLYLLNFPFDVDWLKTGGYIKIWLMSDETAEENANKSFEISVEFDSALTAWKAGYSLADYYESLEERINQPHSFSIQMNDSLEGLTYGFIISNRNFVSSLTEISLLVADFLSEIKILHEEVEKKLLATEIGTRYNLYFNFTPEIKISCEQYLLYFAQFLQDLGIRATSDLKEEAGKVLFSIIPTHDKEALDKIREALAVYLNLPASPIVYDDSFAAMRLQQQIENLQHSQRMAVRELQFNEKLLIAQSDTIHEKNITLSQQQSVIEQQNKIIEKISSKSVMMDSVENKEELEEIYDGLKIGESEFLKKQLGIHLNPAKVIKTAVKNTFGKQNENESVLGLDEE